MLEDIKHQKLFLNNTTLFTEWDIDLYGKSILYNEPTTTL